MIPTPTQHYYKPNLVTIFQQQHSVILMLSLHWDATATILDVMSEAILHCDDTKLPYMYCLYTFLFLFKYRHFKEPKHQKKYAKDQL